jgi:fatty-acyl-CoA synthase
MAECCLAVSISSPGRPLLVDWVRGAFGIGTPISRSQAGDPTAKPLVRCGEPLPGVDVRILDADGQELPEGWSGSIVVRGPSVMSGYLEGEELSRRAFTEDGWFITDDIGYMAGGEIVVAGRRKELIVYDGRNLWPQDLEHLVRMHGRFGPGDVVAFSVPGAEGAEEPVVLVQQGYRSGEDWGELANRIRGAVRDALGVRCKLELVPPGTLPRTSSGKPRRVDARAYYAETRGIPLQAS